MPYALLEVRVERNFGDRPAAFFGIPSLCVVDENSPHDLRGDGEEVLPAGPLNLRLIGQSQIRFVNQVGRAEGVIGSLVAQFPVGNLTQLVINIWHQPVEGAAVASIDLAEDFGNGFFAGAWA